MYLFLNFT
jgi:hypothetical protein